MTGKKSAIPEQELRETLECAHEALSEIARTKGLHPDGEHARDLCGDALHKLGRGRRRARGYSI